jgi:hypothetical protein
MEESGLRNKGRGVSAALLKQEKNPPLTSGRLRLSEAAKPKSLFTIFLSPPYPRHCERSAAIQPNRLLGRRG